MFGTLFLKECKEILKSVTFYIFLACMVVFFVTQMGEFEGVTKPIPGQESYGVKNSNDEKVIMNSTITELVLEYDVGEYVTYPIGFYKKVILNEQQQKQVSGIIQELTGLNEQQLQTNIKEYWNDVRNNSDGGYVESSRLPKDKFPVKANLSYQKFLDYMGQINDLLGGGSKYKPEDVSRNAKVPMTYADALKEYEDIVYKDNVSRAYSRLFSDYMGIVLGILPVFLAVTRGLRDKRAKASEVIFSKKTSSLSIIVPRYAATVAMIFIPVLLLSITPTLQSLYCASNNGVQVDYFAFIKVIFGWLLPTILVSVSVGFFFTELTDGPLGILIQGVWWLVSIFLSMGNLVGNVGWNLIPRFNTVGAYEKYNEVFYQLVINRLFYSLIGIILLLATVGIYQLKRKGALNINGKILSNRKGKLEV